MSGKGKGSKGKVKADAYMEANYVFDVSNQVPCKRQRLPNDNRAVVIPNPIDGVGYQYSLQSVTLHLQNWAYWVP